MTITADDLRNLRLQLAQAESEFAEQKRLTRPQAVERMSELRTQLEALEREAKKVAEDAGLVFYYSSGYEGWYWVESSDWSSSTANC